MRIKLALCGALMVLGTQGALATEVGFGVVQITRVITYSAYGGGDVIADVSPTIPGCSGIWLRPSDPGFQENYSALLSARMANRSISAWVDDADTWAGSNTKFCRLVALSV